MVALALISTLIYCFPPILWWFNKYLDFLIALFEIPIKFLYFFSIYSFLDFFWWKSLFFYINGFFSRGLFDSYISLELKSIIFFFSKYSLEMFRNLCDYKNWTPGDYLLDLLKLSEFYYFAIFFIAWQKIPLIFRFYIIKIRLYFF